MSGRPPPEGDSGGPKGSLRPGFVSGPVRAKRAPNAPSDLRLSSPRSAAARAAVGRGLCLRALGDCLVLAPTGRTPSTFTGSTALWAGSPVQGLYWDWASRPSGGIGWSPRRVRPSPAPGRPPPALASSQRVPGVVGARRRHRPRPSPLLARAPGPRPDARASGEGQRRAPGGGASPSGISSGLVPRLFAPGAGFVGVAGP